MENECAHCMPDGYMKGADTRQDAEATDPGWLCKEVLMEYVEEQFMDIIGNVLELNREVQRDPGSLMYRANLGCLFDGLAS